MHSKFALILLKSSGKFSVLPGISMNDLAFKKVILTLVEDTLEKDLNVYRDTDWNVLTIREAEVWERRVA